jgi:hypothetical protein
MVVSGMKIAKLLVAIAVLSFLATPVLSAYQNADNSCSCRCSHMSEGCGSQAMSCNGKMNCNSKCSYDSSTSKECSCFSQSSAPIVIDVYDPSSSYIGRGSSRTYGKESLLESSSGKGSAFFGDTRVDSGIIGPPDLDVVEYLPSSAKLVFRILVSEGPLTQKDLIDKTELPPRTVRYALSRLKEESVIKECFYFPDARQSLYGLNTAAI